MTYEKSTQPSSQKSSPKSSATSPRGLAPDAFLRGVLITILDPNNYLQSPVALACPGCSGIRIVKYPSDLLRLLRQPLPDLIILDTSLQGSFPVINAAKHRGVPVLSITNFKLLVPAGVGFVRREGLDAETLRGGMVDALRYGEQKKSLIQAAAARSRRVHTLNRKLTSAS